MKSSWGLLDSYRIPGAGFRRRALDVSATSPSGLSWPHAFKRAIHFFSGAHARLRFGLSGEAKHCQTHRHRCGDSKNVQGQDSKWGEAKHVGEAEKECNLLVNAMQSPVRQYRSGVPRSSSYFDLIDNEWRMVFFRGGGRQESRYDPMTGYQWVW